MFIEISTLIGVPIVRSVAGWLENALEDGEITNFEWGQLGSTIFRMGVVGFALFYGLDMGVLAAAGSSVHQAQHQ